MGEIRKGKVSSVDYENGMVRVTYSDKGKSVTKNFPYMNFNNEYNMPQVGQSVAVLHLSNGSSRGMVLGTYWNKRNKPPESGAGVYRKEMGAGGYQKCAGGTYEVVAPQEKFTAENKIETSTKKMLLDVENNIEIIAKAIDIQLEEKLNAAVKEVLAQVEEKIEFIAKSINLQGENGVNITSRGTAEIKTEEQMNLEDSSWKTTLSRIMERLERLDGNMADRK